jgi:hypothetical protein
LASLVVVVFGGCNSGSDGELSNFIYLETDTALSLYCSDEGIFPENCTLFNPRNPYRFTSFNDENKFELSADSPSAKSKFYLWATVLAGSAQGENQYEVAGALHLLYTEGGGTDTLVRQQALKAYRSVLDNFYYSYTYFEADYLPGKPVYAVNLRDLVGGRLYDPSGDGLLPLFTDPEYALEALGDWGYAYDIDNEILF